MKKNNGSMYQRHPELYRYTSSERYENPKEDFKTIGNKMASLLDESLVTKVVHVGTGNGEILYYLHKRFPHWQLNGYDQTAEFVATAKAFPGLSDVNIQQSDLYDIEGQYGVVTACCFLSLFREFEKPVTKLIELCRPGGFIMATGLFNPYDIDVRVEYCDNSKPESRGIWQTDSNRHSQRRVSEYLKDSVKSIEFEECHYDLSLAYDENNPMHVWTENNKDKSPWLINGAWQIANQTLMVIQK